MVAMEILLPWQQDRFRGIETPVLVWGYFLAKNNHFQKWLLGVGVLEQEMNCEFFVLLIKVVNRK